MGVELFGFVFFLMIRRPPRSTQSRSSAASDVYQGQLLGLLFAKAQTCFKNFALPSLSPMDIKRFLS